MLITVVSVGVAVVVGLFLVLATRRRAVLERKYGHRFGVWRAFQVYGLVVGKRKKESPMTVALEAYSRFHGEVQMRYYETQYGFESSCKSRKEYEGWVFDLEKDEKFFELSGELASAQRKMLRNLALRREVLGTLHVLDGRQSSRVVQGAVLELETVLEAFKAKPVSVTLTVRYVSPGGRVNLSKNRTYDVRENTDLSLYVATGTMPAVSSAQNKFFTNEESLNRPGIYVYTYPSFIKDGAFPVKIGMTEAQTVTKRVRDQEKDGAGIPERAVILASSFVSSPSDVERKLHLLFRDFRTVGGGREWFKLDIQQLSQGTKKLDLEVWWNESLYREWFRCAEDPSAAAPSIVPGVGKAEEGAASSAGEPPVVPVPTDAGLAVDVPEVAEVVEAVSVSSQRRLSKPPPKLTL